MPPLTRIRLYTTLFILGLILSGLTAFPLQSELALLLPHLPPNTALAAWITRVHDALADTNARYPFLAYGTDWLAFAHLVIALAFVGLYKDPLRNRWLVTWGILCCLAVLPTALIAGQIRGIPFPWRLLDCSFGLSASSPSSPSTTNSPTSKIPLPKRQQAHPLRGVGQMCPHHQQEPPAPKKARSLSMENRRSAPPNGPNHL